MPFISGIGPVELIIVLVIALIVIGPGKLPDVGSALGKSIREFRKAATDVKEAASLDPTPAAQTPAAPTPAAAPAAPAAVVTTPAVAALPPAPPAPPMAPPAPVVDATADPAAAVADASEWPADVVPVDETQATPSA
jgi:TatA/E family protein of Tat protein translocase